MFLVQALAALVLPLAVWRFAGLRRAAPLAVVQILVGVALGPSLLGRVVPPEMTAPLIGPSALAPLSGIATLAVTLFAFVTGLHIDEAQLRGRGPALAWVGIGSAIVPTLLGAVAGFVLANVSPETLGPRASPVAFAAAIGVCAGVTALPVLGAILAQLGWLKRRIGQLALACAALNDALLWALLAGVLALGAGGDERSAWLPLVGGAVYLVLLLGVVRPALDRSLAGRAGEAGDIGLAAGCGLALASAAVTELLGLHHILGAFLAGVAVPPRARGALLERLEAPVTVALMPFFFVLTGLRTTIDLGSGAFLAAFLLPTLATTAGKLGGTAVLARAAGETWPTALGLGALMQTKGLMEVVVLTVLLEAGLVAPVTFSALVLMALASTAATMPLARLFVGDDEREAGAVPATAPLSPG